MDVSSIARRIPDEFLTAPGLPVQRALLLAQRYWPSRSDSDLRQLAASLRVVLEPLVKSPRGTVPAEMRDECERLVREWDARVSGKDG